MKLKKVLVLTGITAILATTLIGCAKEAETPLEESSSTTTTQMTLDYNIEKKEDKKLAIDVLDVDLGQGTLIDPSGREVNYPIRGTMAVPKDEGSYPVVLIAHGSHSGSSKDRFDDGFKYLVEAIAQQGYIALSMDIQKQFALDDGEPQWILRTEEIYKQHISMLKEANAGKDMGYNIDLTGKIDLDNQILIGHSQSGQDVLLLADKLIQEGDTRVKGIISIAPARIFHVSKVEQDGVPPSPQYYGDVPTGFIIPEYDGDVATLDGLTLYDKILKEDTERKSPMSAVVLKGGKHNFFNTRLEEDAVFLESNIVMVNKLDKEQHKEFIIQYCIDFLKAILDGKVENTVFDWSAPAPNAMYGYDVITKLSVPEAKGVDLVDVTNEQSIKGDQVAVVATVEDWIAINDDIGPFRDPRLSYPINLLALTWHEKGSSVAIDVSDHRDFSQYEALALQVTQDPTNTVNEVDVNQGFTIVLKDTKGNESKVVVGQDTTVLGYTPGTVVALEDFPYYSNYTIIGEVRIPLAYFEGVDLSQIESLSLVFDQTNQGNIVIEEFKLK